MPGRQEADKHALTMYNVHSSQPQRSYKDIPMLFPLLPLMVAPVEVIPVKALFGQVVL